jgi:hypothetical protein
MLETASGSCPMCARLWEAVLKLELSKLNESECQDLMKLFQSTDYSNYRRIYLRSLAQLARQLETEDDPLENARNQGRSQQVRIMLALPTEIKGLLAEFAEHDKRLEELAEAKEKRNVEVR